MDTLSLTKKAKIYNGEKTVSLTSCAKKKKKNWSTTCKRMKLEYFITLYIRINSKGIKDLNVRPELIKLFSSVQFSHSVMSNSATA